MSRAEQVISFTVLLAVSLFVLYSRGGEWQGDWNWTLSYAMGTTVLTGPVAAAIAAWLAASRHGLRVMTDPAPRGWLVGARWAGEAWLAGMAALVATTVVASVYTLIVPHGGPIDMLNFAEAPVLLAAYAAMGAAAGILLPHPVTAVLMAPLTFLAAMVGAEYITFDFLRATIMSTGSVAGLRWSGLTVLEAVTGLAAVTCVLIALTFGVSAHRLAMVALASVGIALLGASAAVSHTHGTEQWEPSGEFATECAGTAPVVCVMPSNVGALAALAPEVDRLAAYLRRAGATVPQRFEQSLLGVKDPSIGGFDLNEGGLTRVDPELAAAILSTPSDCPAYRSFNSPPPDIAFTARDLIKAWILRQAGEHVDLDDGHERTWQRSSPAAQRAWVVRTYAQLAACDLRHLRPPWKRGKA